MTADVSKTDAPESDSAQPTPRLWVPPCYATSRPSRRSPEP